MSNDLKKLSNMNFEIGCPPYDNPESKDRYNGNNIYYKNKLGKGVAKVYGLWENHTLEELEKDERCHDYLMISKLFIAAPKLLKVVLAFNQNACDSEHRKLIDDALKMIE